MGNKTFSTVAKISKGGDDESSEETMENNSKTNQQPEEDVPRRSGLIEVSGGEKKQVPGLPEIFWDTNKMVLKVQKSLRWSSFQMGRSGHIPGFREGHPIILYRSGRHDWGNRPSIEKLAEKLLSQFPDSLTGKEKYTHLPQSLKVGKNDGLPYYFGQTMMECGRQVPNGQGTWIYPSVNGKGLYVFTGIWDCGKIRYGNCENVAIDDIFEGRENEVDETFSYRGYFNDEQQRDGKGIAISKDGVFIGEWKSDYVLKGRCYLSGKSGYFEGTLGEYPRSGWKYVAEGKWIFPNGDSKPGTFYEIERNFRNLIRNKVHEIAHTIKSISKLNIEKRLGKEYVGEGAMRYLFHGANSAVFLVNLRGWEAEDSKLVLKLVYNLSHDHDGKHLSKLINDEEFSTVRHANLMCTLGSFIDNFEVKDFPHLDVDLDIVSKRSAFFLFPLCSTDLLSVVHRLDKKIVYTTTHDFASLCLQILDGLCELHKNGIQHRDLKLDNIFIDYIRGIAIIGDFGCQLDSKKLGLDKDFIVPFEKEEISKGGAMYCLPPEIIEAKPKQDGVLDYSKCDVFAAGLTLYKVMLGHNAEPFLGCDNDVSKREMSLYVEPEKSNKSFGSDDEMKEICEVIQAMVELDFGKRVTCYEARDRLKKTQILAKEPIVRKKEESEKIYTITRYLRGSVGDEMGDYFFVNFDYDSFFSS